MNETALKFHPLDEDGRSLLARLEALSLGPENARLTFEQRLARENAWSIEYARRVCHEYRRFVLLCHLSGRPLTPSDAVDQAWHLHLCYSRSYWHRMCRDVLGRPLHHEPTRGGRAEGTKFVDWYEATREAYEAMLGEPPPADIWPSSRERFATATAFRRVNTAEHWVISRSAVRRNVRTGSLFAFVLAALAGCSWTGNDSGFFLVLCLAGAVFVGVLLIQQYDKRGRRRRNDSGWGFAGCGGGTKSFWGKDGDSGSDSGDGGSGCGSGCGGCGGCGG